MGAAGVTGRPEPPAAPGEGPDRKWRRRGHPEHHDGDQRGRQGADVGRFWAPPLPPTTPSFGTAFLAPGATLGRVPGGSADEVGAGAAAALPAGGKEYAGADAVGWPACPGAPVGVGSNRSQPAPAK